MERGKENYRYVLHGWLLSRKVFMASGKQLHIKQITERSLIIERLFSFKEQGMTKRKHWCNRFQHVNLHLVHWNIIELLYLICVTLVSMKILTLPVINGTMSSHHIECALYRETFTFGLCQKPWLTCTLCLSFDKQILRITLYAAFSVMSTTYTLFRRTLSCSKWGWTFCFLN